NPSTHERVLGRTLDVIRRRRQLRRAGWIAALAACFGAGMLTALSLRATSEPVIVTMQRDVVPPSPEPNKQEVIPIQTPRAELLRQVGDHLLTRDDPLAALSCYTRSLDDSRGDELTVSTDDSWLLLAIKDARMKEKRDAKAND